MIRLAEAVSSAIKTRRLAKSAGNDGAHIALVVEGGGMRGVAAGGMVSALEDLGLTNVFDSVHGSSAGAAAAAYFAVGQAKIGTSLFYEDLNDGRFISRGRILRGGPILDAKFLVDYAMTQLKPFNFAGLRDSPKLHIVCTDIDRGETYVVSEFPSAEYYRDVLKASVTLPLIAGKARLIDGRRLLDGGLLQQIALKSAVDAGASHIFALVTRGESEIYRDFPNFKTRLEGLALQCLYGGKVGQLYYERNHTINEQIAQILAGATYSGVPIMAVGLPEQMNYIHRLTTDADLMRRAAKEAYDYTIRNFEHLV
jgi:predicted patatin/cPLA2 family phospholipase